MQKILLTFTIILLAGVSSNFFALEKGSWTLTKDNDWCYKIKNLRKCPLIPLIRYFFYQIY